MKKRFVTFALFLAMSLSLCVHAKNSEDVQYDTYKKIAPNLYEVTVDSYDYDHVFKTKRANREYFMGCSAIRQGNYFGRNFDFFAGDVPEIVVKTTAKEGRYASVGMVGGLMWISTSLIDTGLDEDSKKLIPNMMLDGINEKGLVVEINCVNAVDVGGMTKHTNPGKKPVAQIAVVRYLLDKAASADEAIAIMKEIDIVNDPAVMGDIHGLTEVAFELHFLIADKDKTYLVEFNNTKPEGQKIVVMEESVMTNFYRHLADPQKNIFPDHSIGVERYRKLVDNRHSVSSMEDMKALMRSVRYSNSSRQDGEYAPGKKFNNPYTCYSDHPVFGEKEIIYANHKKHIRELLREMKNEEAKTAAVLKDPKLSNPEGMWVTSHSAVFDIPNKTMSVAIFERFDKYYDYSLK